MAGTRAVIVSAVTIAALQANARADDLASRSRCREVRADMAEDLVTAGCKPGETSCYVGEVDGRGLHATTHFKGDSSAAGPGTSPGWVSYSGLFEYTTDRGVIKTRETGVVNTTQGNLQSGAVTAMQVIVEGTGAYEGATGYFFVSGFNVGGHVETEVTGKICRR